MQIFLTTKTQRHQEKTVELRVFVVRFGCGHCRAGQTLNKTNWRIKGKNGAAKLLRLKPSTLYSKMAKLGISTLICI
jgi:hypothetical protein